MSKGTRVRSIRISDKMFDDITTWGQRYLTTNDFSVIIRHLIDRALKGK